MPTATKTKTAEKTVEPVKATDDARGFLMTNLPREQGDSLRIMQVFPGAYRVNWFAPDKDPGTVIQTFKLRKSCFIHCRLGNDGKVEVYDIPERQ